MEPSDFIQKLVATGLVSANDFNNDELKYQSRHMFGPSGRSLHGLTWPEHQYKYLYLKRHDQQTIGQLIDQQYIGFGNIEYEEFMASQMQLPNLEDGDDLVLACSSCTICFDYPCQAKAMFMIRADDDITGFTRKELALKVMQLYCMMAFNYKNYDKTTGKLQNSQLVDKNDPERAQRIFAPIVDEEWEENGIIGITYNKEKDYWVCQCSHYI